MGFRDGLKSFVAGLLGYKQASALIGGTRPLPPSTSFTAMVRDGYRRNELIFACLDKKAKTASQVRLVVRNVRTGEDDEESGLANLLKSPNEVMTQASFVASIIIFLDLAGVAYYQKIKSPAGRTIALIPMRPDKVKPLVNDAGVLIGYSYDMLTMPLPADDVLAIRLFDPLGGPIGYPPVAVAAEMADMDNAVTDYLRMIFDEGGIPPGVLSTEQPINQTIAEEIRALWMKQYGGYKNWAAPAVLGHGTKYERTGLSIQEMGIDYLDKRAELRICMALHVPPMLVGAGVGLERATYSNMVEAQRDWWMNDMMPLYKMIGDALQKEIADKEYKGLEVGWDFDSVPALAEYRQEMRKVALDAFRAGAITRNQFNEMWGLPSLGSAGDMYLLSMSAVEVPAGTLTVQGRSALTPPKSDSPKAAGLPEGGKAEKKDFEMKARSLSQIESDIRDAALRFLSDELSRILAIVRDEGGNAAVDPSFWEQEAALLYGLLRPYLQEAALLSAAEAFVALQQAGMEISWDIVNENAIAWAEAHTREVVAQIIKTSMDGFVAEFGDWVRSGEPLDALVARLEKYYSPVRANMIAVTETTRAYASAQVELFKMSGMVSGWQWIPAVDDLVCPICVEKGKGGPYKLDDEHPPAHVNCRCAVRPVLAKS